MRRKNDSVSKSRKNPLSVYRRRLKRRGIVRVEVQVRKEDAGLLRNVARALADPERALAARAWLGQRFGRPRAEGLKALLAEAPLEGIDLERSHDPGRPVQL
jgi:hypothetical protein